MPISPPPSSAQGAVTAASAVLGPAAVGWSEENRSYELELSEDLRSVWSVPVKYMVDDRNVTLGIAVGNGKFTRGCVQVAFRVVHPMHYENADVKNYYLDRYDANKKDKRGKLESLDECLKLRYLFIGVFTELPTDYSNNVMDNHGFYYSSRYRKIYPTDFTGKKPGFRYSFSEGDLLKMELDIPQGNLVFYLNGTMVTEERNSSLIKEGVYIVVGMRGYRNLFPRWIIESSEVCDSGK